MGMALPHGAPGAQEEKEKGVVVMAMLPGSEWARSGARARTRACDEGRHERKTPTAGRAAAAPCAAAAPRGAPAAPRAGSAHAPQQPRPPTRTPCRPSLGTASAPGPPCGRPPGRS